MASGSRLKNVIKRDRQVFSLEDGAGYLLILDMEMSSPTAPKFFWSLTFRESVRNQEPTPESIMRLTTKSGDLWKV